MVQAAHLRSILEEEEAKAARGRGKPGEIEGALSKSNAIQGLDYHKRDIESLMKELETSKEAGLTNQQVEEKRKNFGSNKLKEKAVHPWYVRLGSEFVTAMQIILWVGAILSFIGYSLDKTDPSNVF